MSIEELYDIMMTSSPEKVLKIVKKILNENDLTEEIQQPLETFPCYKNGELIPPKPPRQENIKRCTKCKKWKPFSEFYKNITRKYGLTYYCKECINETHHNYYEENKEELKEYNRKYREENKEELKEYSRKYREENPKKIKESRRKYYEENPEKVKESSRKSYWKNPEKARKRNRKSHKKLKDTVFECFGWECRYCGIKIALVLDHRCGDGGKPRKEVTKTRREARDLFESDPKKARKKFQILCANCNALKGHLESVIGLSSSDEVIAERVQVLLDTPGIDKDRVLEDVELIKEYYKNGLFRQTSA